MQREDAYEPGNEADELLSRLGLLDEDDADSVDEAIGRAGVLAVLQVARELRRTRLAIVELARVIVDELGRTPAP